MVQINMIGAGHLGGRKQTSRNGQSDSEASTVADGADEADGSPEDRAQTRIDRERRHVAEIERKDPLRARLLQALADDPATPSELARAAGAASESVSRQLRALREAGLVRDERMVGDRRQRCYSLTDEGAWQLSRHRAFGAPRQPPPPPGDEEAEAFLRAGLERAVELRRKTHELGEASTRLRAVLEQAQKRGLPDLALDAMAELATTLRQDRQFAEMGVLLGRLDEIALGQVELFGSTLVLPATAHRDYALGRVADGHDDNNLSVRATHLVTAAMSYQRLSRAASEDSSARRWRGLQAWSIASLAGNLREQSRFEPALYHAALAMSLFDELGDTYGRSRCLFMLGYCWRLLGDFDEAWQRLCAARTLAAADGYMRFEADALMQMGEVRRCQGHPVAARELLQEALEHGRRLDLTVTMAFAQSALGAVEYQEQRFEPAREALQQAHALFDACGHQEGLALNARRQAIVARSLFLGRRREFHEAERLIADASDRYRDLRSPAGITACEIEGARLYYMRHGKAPAQIAQLLARLGESEQSELVELDPWVPHQLASFAEYVGDDALAERARLLLADGQRRLAQLRPQAVPRATPPSSVEAPIVEHVFGGGFEMGGETRSQRGDGGGLFQLAPVPVLA